MNVNILKVLSTAAILIQSSISYGEIYTFTNSGATGQNGPTQNDVTSSYSGTNLANAVTVSTQGIQEWVAPVTGTYEIEVWGAQGGSGGWYSNASYSSTGGLGGYAKGSITLSAGTRIYLLVGQQGEGYPSSSTKMENLAARNGGWNGGGSNSVSTYPGTGGGGASDVRIGGIALSNRVIVGGGGGGGGNSGTSTQLSNGGAGGGLTATTMANSTQFSNRTPGNGATQSSGNALGFGATATQNLSGGGGGGYYGGGAGDNSTGGGGGSSYTGGVSNGSTQSGVRSGHGKIVITSPASSNSSPIINQGNNPISKSLNEDTLVSWSSNELNASDSDTNSAYLSWSIISTPSNGSSTIDGNGTSPTTLTYLPNSNFFGTDSFSVQVSDGENNDSIVINLTINPVNDSTILLGDFNDTINEDNNASGDINATDADGLTDGTYFLISANPSNGSASIDPQSGSWNYTPQANFFGTDSFSVSITDDLGNSSNQVISLNVQPVNDLPYDLSLDNNKIQENLKLKTTIGKVSGNDLESNESIVFSLSDGDGSTHNPLFILENNGTLKTSSILDFESNKTLSIRIKASDSHGGTMDKIFKIFVLNIIEDFDNDGIEDHFDLDDDNDSFSDQVEIAYGSDPMDPNSVANKAPTEISLTNNNITESQSVGSYIGNLLAVDSDLNSSHSFSLVDNNQSTNNHLFYIDTNNSLRTATVFKYIENNSSYKIRIKVFDEHNASLEKAFNIRIKKNETQNFRLGKPTVSIDVSGRASFNTIISLEKNSTLPSFKYEIAKYEDFSDVLFNINGIINKNEIIGSIFNLEENSSYFTRALAKQNGNTIISNTVQFNTYSIPSFKWWLALETNEIGWRKLDWLGTFLPHNSGWIYHHSIGWLYAQPGKEDDFWFWSKTYGWIWTKNGIYPFLYQNNKSNWLYILGIKDGKAVFHDYSEDESL